PRLVGCVVRDDGVHGRAGDPAPGVGVGITDEVSVARRSGRGTGREGHRRGCHDCCEGNVLAHLSSFLTTAGRSGRAFPTGYPTTTVRCVLDFRILGPVEVVADGRPVVLGGPKQRATLAILLLNANRIVSIDRLAHELYAGSPPVTAVTQVQRQISELRKALG